jgi:hypothetical protein
MVLHGLKRDSKEAQTPCCRQSQPRHSPSRCVVGKKTMGGGIEVAVSRKDECEVMRGHQERVLVGAFPY